VHYTDPGPLPIPVNHTFRYAVFADGVNVVAIVRQVLLVATLVVKIDRKPIAVAVHQFNPGSLELPDGLHSGRAQVVQNGSRR
jgi:hypothetical protein